MKTQLVELSVNDHLLRGILTLPDSEINERVICLHGFERCASTESKFKKLADELTNYGAAVLRLDFSGCGLSDGDFRFTTIDSQGKEMLKAIDELEKIAGGGKISFVAHSLGACVIASQLSQINDQVDKIVLLAPALNQKDLLRYWFVNSQMKKSGSDIEITWGNYKDYLHEGDFLKDIQRTDKTAKANYIDSSYFMQNKDVDYSFQFKGNDSRILHVHGTKDVAVPLESLNVAFENQLLIENGDHDLEKPDHMRLWLRRVSQFVND